MESHALARSAIQVVNMKTILPIVLVIVMVILSGCGEVCDAPVYVNDHARGETEASLVRTYTRFSRNYTSGVLLTVEHDGHLWVVYHGFAFQHSPDCPCLKGK